MAASNSTSVAFRDAFVFPGGLLLQFVSGASPLEAHGQLPTRPRPVVVVEKRNRGFVIPLHRIDFIDDPPRAGPLCAPNEHTTARVAAHAMALCAIAGVVVSHTLSLFGADAL
tara:strand:- start:141 stop:479 length:339 start_codon:yes stop_codon:yes gene_type:complete